MLHIYFLFTVQTSKTNLLDIDNDDSPPPQQKVVKVKLHLLLRDSMDVSHCSVNAYMTQWMNCCIFNYGCSLWDVDLTEPGISTQIEKKVLNKDVSDYQITMYKKGF